MGKVLQTGNDIRASHAAVLCAQAGAITVVWEPRVCSVQSSTPVPSWGPTPAGGKGRTVEWEVTFAGSMRKKYVSGSRALTVTLVFSPWETAGPHGEHWADISVRLKGA